MRFSSPENHFENNFLFLTCLLTHKCIDLNATLAFRSHCIMKKIQEFINEWYCALWTKEYNDNIHSGILLIRFY